jgi:branched-chain amino acid transport system ATP-binding protein
MLQARDLTVFYGRVQALAGVSLTVDAGELVALLGPNGAGKTSTLRALSGLVAPASGSITLDGHEITGRPAEMLAAAGVAHVLEGRGIFPRMSVEQNLLVGLYTQRRKRPNRAREMDRVLSFFPRLAERRTQRAATLSGGEQQMLALARALMAKPRYLLVDEPSHGLAPNIAASLFDFFADLRDTGTSVLVVEQHAALALAHADRAYVIEKGRITYEGPPSPLIADKNRLTDAYLGRRR